MNIFAASGVVVGMLVGVILIVVLFKFANTNHVVKTEYDERQQVLRYKGYMVGFYAAIIYEVIMLLISIAEIEIPAEAYVIHFGAIMAGAMALAIHSIWNDVYWGLNNNTKRYIAVFVILFLINAAAVVRAVMAGTLVEDGKLAAASVNLLVAAMILVIGIVLLIKQAADKKAQANED